MLVVWTTSSWAEQEHELLRRVAVFPVNVPRELKKPAEETWWKLREELTSDKRFLVASKNFLLKKDVFQPRSELSPSDAIILGSLLDAQGLVVTYLIERTLHMRVYEGRFGRVLWQKQLRLHPSLPMATQFETAGLKLLRDFKASFPYQGFVVVDPIIGKPWYQKGNKTLVNVDLGSQSQVRVNDKIQLVRVLTDKLKPIFTEGSTIEVFAEGKVHQVEPQQVVVQILRATRLQDIEAETLVRLPSEFKRLRQAFALKENLKRKIRPELFWAEMRLIREEEEEVKPTVTAVSFLSSLAAFLLLAL